MILSTGLNLYYKLSTRSRRAIKREKGRGGHPYNYRPRITLLKRLSEETGMTTEQVRNQLIAERDFLLKHKQYY